MSTGRRAPGTGRTPGILVVEDDDLVRSFVRLLLEDEGYAVVEAAEGAAALRLVQAAAAPPALILLDVKMPGLDGRGFAASYRARPGPHAPIIVMTAARDEVCWLTEVGAVAHVGKPFDLDELVGVVAAVVGAAGPAHPPLESTASH